MSSPLHVILAGLALSSCFIDNGNDEDAPPSGVTVELTQTTATVRPGKWIDLDARVGGSTTWNTATCTVTDGHCTIHVVAPQTFRLEFEAPLKYTTVTLTFAHDGAGGRPGSKPSPLSASALITVEGRMPPPFVSPMKWHSGSHAGRLRDLAFSHDGARLVSAGEDATVRTYEWADGRHAAWIPTAEPERGRDVPFRPGRPTAARFAPDGASILVGNDGWIERYRELSAQRTGVAALPLSDVADPNGNHRDVTAIDCPESGPTCLVLRSFKPNPQCQGNGCGCDGCTAGLFEVDLGDPEALSVTRLVESLRNEEWTALARSPDGARVAVLQSGDIRIFDAKTGRAVTRIASGVGVDRPAATVRWPSADTVVTEAGTYAVSSGLRTGPGRGSGGGGLNADWRDGARQATWAFGPLILIEGGRPRLTTQGPVGTYDAIEVARDAPWIVAHAFGRGDQLDGEELDVFDTGGRRVATLSGRTPRIFGGYDLCTDGTLVFEGPDGLRVAKPPLFVPAALELDGVTPSGSIVAVLDPEQPIVTGPQVCHVFATAGLQRSVLIDVPTSTIVKDVTLPSAPIYTNHATTRYLTPPSSFGAKARIYKDDGSLVLELPATTQRLMFGGDAVWVLDTDGNLKNYRLEDGLAGPAIPYVAPQHVASVYLPRRLLGTLYFPLADKLRQQSLREDAVPVELPVTWGAMPPTAALEMPTANLLILTGQNGIAAYDNQVFVDLSIEAQDH